MPITQKGINKLLKHHKLDADDSTDSDVTDAIKNSVSQDEMDDMENRNKKLDDENKELKNRADDVDKAREKLADETLVKYENRIGKDDKAKKFFREGLLNRRDETLAVLDAMPEPTAVKKDAPLHNRGTAGSPGAVEGEDKTVKKERDRAAKVATRARELATTPAFKNRHRAAFDQAESEIPE